MMKTKILVLDNIVKELKQLEQAKLFGIRNSHNVIVSSLESKNGINEIGDFYSSLENQETDNSNDNLIFSMTDNDLSCFSTNNKGERETAELNIINYKTDFNKRNHGIIDPSILQDKTVTVFGLGSGGSAVVTDLVRCGVVNLNLVEFDTIEISNICRSVYDLTDVGRKKIDALYEKLIRINPCININVYDEDVLKMESGKLRKIISSSDLVIEATDNPYSKNLINGLAYHQTNVIFPAVYKNGCGGDILLTVPQVTPCYECVFGELEPEMLKIKSSGWDYTNDKAKPMPSLISDIKIIVDRTVKLSLALLTADSDNSFLEKVTEPDCSLLLIGNESDFYIFDKPFQEIWAETEINPECSCQTLC